MNKLITAGISILVLLSANLHSQDDGKAQREKAQKLQKDGNYKDALDIYMKQLGGTEKDTLQLPFELEGAVMCLRRLNRINEFDEVVEKAVFAYPASWRLLAAAARAYFNIDHYGFIVAGKFERGEHRGQGRMVNSYERDRCRALQLYVQAMPLAEKDTDRIGKYQFFMEFARSLQQTLDGSAWRLQYPTVLSKLPDYEEGAPWNVYRYGMHGGDSRGAPVDEDGKPVYYKIPASFADAANDGERWRLILDTAKKYAPENDKGETDVIFADFLLSQFGVQTMASFRNFYGEGEDDDGEDGGNTVKEESGPYAVHTLSDDETIAKLANGTKRFKLPEEFNFLKIYRRVASTGDASADNAIDKLAQVYTDRRQYPKAAEVWREAIKRFGPGSNGYRQKQLDQIVGKWGVFESGRPQAAGKDSDLYFRFRNASLVKLQAFKINVSALIDDAKKYIRSNPGQLQYEKIDFQNIGWRLINKDEKKYIGESAAEWEQKLTPLENHFDSRITVKVPLKKAGAYLVVASIPDGNTSRIVLWLDDIVLLKKKLMNKEMIYVADAVTGKPVEGASVECFGYAQEYLDPKKNPKGRRVNFVTKEPPKKLTDRSGIVYFTKDELKNEENKYFTWLETATAKDGRSAFIGFTHVWFPGEKDYEYKQTKIFCMTDRPVYRPGDKVDFKLWIRKAQYDQEDNSEFAKQNFILVIRDPKGQEILKQQLTSDEFAGIQDSYLLGKSATLGVYWISIENYGDGGSFRVEEYKKPEFEVTVEAPKEPVKLGDTIDAKITAKYYFGAPVTQAKVNYKVMRYDHDTTWYPPFYWDWLYMPGYWWFAYDYDWYPGWRGWGCKCPVPWWRPFPRNPPELVMENEVQIGEDGTVEIEIDSSLAKELHPDKDHRYEITAEVVDQSRRTITGKGSVIAARKPFKVYSWTDQGYYRTGDVITANFAARTVDGKPVKGKGRLKLLGIKYGKEMKPDETTLESWKLEANEEGRASQQIKAAKPGQYRLSFTLEDSKGNEAEGGYIFSVRDSAESSESFRFNDIEIVNNHAEYEPGEKAGVFINTARSGGTVLFFTRPVNGVYDEPEVIDFKGKSAFREVEITKKDMPNFFLEAVTIADGKIYSTMKQIVVPPEKRVLNVEVLPSKEKFKPGEEAKARIRITDLDGKPVKSSIVATVYDKSVEYISGGSNVQEIKEFFWKWQRHHNITEESSLQKIFSNILKSGETTLQALGVFGNISDEQTLGMAGGKGGRTRGFGGEVRRKAAEAEGFADAMPAAPMVLAAAAPMKLEAATDKDVLMDMDGGEAGGGAGEVGKAESVAVRKDFADTAFWASSIQPDQNGEAEIKLKMPENLTTWKIMVWGMAHGTKVGQGSTEVITSKNFIIRLQAPRFFVEKDEVVLSAVVHNYLDSSKSAKVSLELGGGTVKALDETTKTVKIDEGGEVRVDWRVSVLKEGEAVITMKAVTDEDSDAMQMKFPVYVHGMEKMVAYSGNIRPEAESANFAVDVPEQRRPAETRLEIRYSPTLAGAMVDALPYLLDYPYGCTEQTLNRFLPAAVTRYTLKRMGVDLKKIQEKKSNLNAQEIGEDRERAAQWKRFDRNPVFDEKEMDEIISENVRRLEFMQNSDGGWGWFSGFGEESYPHTTATVVHGFQVAKNAGVKIDENSVARGVEWLKNYQDGEIRKIKNWEKKIDPRKEHADDLDALVYMVLGDAGVFNGEMKGFIYRDRNEIGVYAKAMFGLALLKEKEQEKLNMIMQNISQYLVKDDENQTAYLNLGEGNCWWFWYGSEIEAMAYYLKLLSAVEPKGTTAPALVKYLLNNRKHSTYWNSTRDTALCIEAFSDYLEASGEASPDMTVEVYLDGEMKKTVRITGADLFTFDNKFVIEGESVKTGKHDVKFVKKGKGPLYFNSYLTYFSLEDPIKKAGLEIKVDRKYYRLKKVAKTTKVSGSRGQAIDQKVEKYEREEIKDLAVMKSGELAEIEMTIESKNDYEYLIFEDMKPAGFEPCEVRSGYNGNDMGAYVEFRDEKVCFFVRALARGKHSVSYRMRAEIPGRFSALPTKGYAMYAPELKANSDEFKIVVEDAK